VAPEARANSTRHEADSRRIDCRAMTSSILTRMSFNSVVESGEWSLASSGSSAAQLGEYRSSKATTRACGELGRAELVTRRAGKGDRLTPPSSLTDGPDARTRGRIVPG
jgi:hypothetical protein